MLRLHPDEEANCGTFGASAWGGPEQEAEEIAFHQVDEQVSGSLMVALEHNLMFITPTYILFAIINELAMAIIVDFHLGSCSFIPCKWPWELFFLLIKTGFPGPLDKMELEWVPP